MKKILTEQDQIDIEINRRICKNSLFGTLVHLWDTIIPDPFTYNWHIEYICNEMQKVGEWVINRQPSQYDLIINVPPGTTKSTICSVFFHVWLWINAPWIRLISASHTSELAIDQSILARDVLKSQKFNELFPNRVIFKGDQDNKTYYRNIRGGSRAATSVGGAITGKHAHIITLDDLVNPKQVASDVERDKANNWIDRTISTRKIDKENTPIVLIMQRLHELDPTGHLLDKSRNEGKKIRHICLPADLTLDNVMPKKIRMLYKGGLLDPKRMGKRVLAAEKINLGISEYTGQYIQSPQAPGGNIIKRHWIKTYTELPDKKQLSRAQSWDTAFKKGKENAHNCCGDWIEFEHGLYLDNVFVERMDYPQLKQQVIINDGDFRPDFTLVEDKATGTPLIQELSIDTRINFVPILPEGDKVARAHAVSPTFESGNIYIRGNASWSRLVIEQLTMFPNCKIKDIMDMVSQYITYIRQHPSYSPDRLLGGGDSKTTRGFDNDR